MGNIIVAQSGGPTVAINASLAGVIEGALSSKYDTIYGSINGITGIIDNNIINLSEVVKSDSNFLKKLKVTPAMYLGSCRFKLPSVTSNDPIYNTLFQQFKKYDIEAFFYIGGNDSMDTVDKLSAYAKSIDSPIRFIGVPKTVDNDLCVTDHTPGFGSAAKYIATTTMEVIYDAKIYNTPSVTIIEVMGRDAGWLTSATSLARNNCCCGPDLIYLPEVPFDTEVFVNDLSKLLKEKTNIVVAVSEGIRDAKGEYISASTGQLDNFGHAQLSGAGKTLEYIVKDKLGVKVRSIEVNVLQRAAAHMSSLTDLQESVELGKHGVQFAEEGVTGAMVVLNRTSNAPYTVDYSHATISDIANEAKEVPQEWINESHNWVTNEMIEYLKPLVIGEPELEYANGLPVYVTR
ncbi:6-phosphofructokinase [Pseudobutyrivibrio ruminis]|uniref:Pyrophosphate--fructose 6-phosphate 1-phosphotransferase n=1 Tax=Pseudobutyrivibrio ruminis DSM 9787 TaxID=1123011 RepID=A0A285SKC4_9FIRM|nr:6-phosphofructokinase [Pseudobutyrivibrio ruminis]SOC08469.1 6-phosphofructokinase 1 [Pseudobutyrivibrio ruminis DSM 9787]